MLKNKPETLNTAIKTAVAKATGENIVGAIRSQREYALIKTAQFSGTSNVSQRMIRTSQYNGNTNVTSPNFYTPFTTPSAFQIPNNRKEIYLWAQWWFDNEPKVAAAIEFYTDFPLSGFELECANGYVKDYFDELVKKLNFSKLLPLLAQEYHLRGDVFLMGSIDCKKCKGLNVDEDGEDCDHSGASWNSVTILNPDTIESSGYFLDQEPQYYMMPTDDMVKVVQEKTPKELYDRIPDEIKKKILLRAPIFIEPISMYHMKRGAAPWQPYGTSMVRRLFPTLAYKDKLRQAQWLVAERHIIPVKIVKIGSDDRPASDEDIEAAQNELTNVANDPLLTLVTHHNFNFDYVGANGKVLTLSNEYELIDQDIIDGFMLNKAIINGEGPSYNNAQVGLLTMGKRLERFRGEVSYYLEERLFKPVAEWNGFTIEGERGQQEVIYPKIKWDDLELRDNTGKLQTMQAAQQAGIISAQTFIEELGLDYDQEVERLRFEQTANFINTPNADLGSAGGGYGEAGGAGLGGGSIGEVMGGIGGAGGAEAPGGEPGAEGAMGVPGEAAPASAMASTNGSEESYRFVSAIINGLYNEKMGLQENTLQQRKASKTIKSEAHQRFIESTPLVTGRGYFGPLPEEPPIFAEAELSYPIDGGEFCRPLNSAAIVEYNNIRLAKKNERQPPKTLFSKLEQELYNIIINANIPYPFYAQYQAGPGLQYQLDGAFPAIKLGVEADSKTFHSSPEKIASDKQRDISLASQGWTILRFTEEEIRQQPQEILNVIIKALKQLLSKTTQSNNTI
jgi:very-short-patch-repair endonuclease